MNWQISEDEITFLTGGDDHNDDNVVLEKLFCPNLKLLVVTEGSKGCRHYTKVMHLSVRYLAARLRSKPIQDVENYCDFSLVPCVLTNGPIRVSAILGLFFRLPRSEMVTKITDFTMRNRVWFAIWGFFVCDLGFRASGN
ncbi:hypothetical protein Pint_15566 [Pistacia integerrima]|uniref:Uncharacterized protein n=1 Tax=Pistacia integerrima TaxID=434235 RepID=A0ACC0Z807_9ROSI|nr:hypothetical protein Pint_15566 [Pistacia integerrima]